MKKALQEYQENLHISHSQIFCYLACSLKYQFQYVLQLPKERISLALPFGKAIHTSIERYYRSLMEDRTIVSLELMETIFEESLTMELDSAEVPIFFKSEAPDTDSAITMGKGLLKTFLKTSTWPAWRLSLLNYHSLPPYTPLMARGQTLTW